MVPLMDGDGFKLTDVDGLVLGYDLADPANYMQESGNVSYFHDVSGNGRHAAQSTPARQASYRPDVETSARGGAFFDGAASAGNQDYYTIENSTALILSGMTLVAVTAPSDAPPTQFGVLFDSNSGGGYDTIRLYKAGGVPGYGVRYSTTPNHETSGGSENTLSPWDVVIATVTNGTAGQRIWANKSPALAADGTNSKTATAPAIGVNPVLGANSAASGAYLRGALGVFGIYNRVLSGSELVALAVGLSDRFGARIAMS